MRTRAESNSEIRETTCDRCGRTFECSADADCWCAAETYRLPMPAGDSSCLCPACLRNAAAEAK